MPYKNRVKIYEEGAYYHVYNRGQNKQKVFKDDHDYNVFLSLIKRYLDPDYRIFRDLNGVKVELFPEKFTDDIEIHAFCLMPNHFHLIVRQITKYGMPKLISPILSSYTAFFNKKYKQTASIWQGTYRAVRVLTDPQLMHLSRYIHANPLPLLKKHQDLLDYPYSSYSYYVKGRPPVWLKTKEILQGDVGAEYKAFVDTYKKMSKKQLKKEQSSLKDLTIENFN